jgi:hypothetical protein
MQLSNRLLTQGILSLLAITLVPCTSASAMQPVFGQPPISIQQEQQPMPSQGAESDKQAAKDVVVTGTIVKSDLGFILRDSSGTEYRLDAQKKAESFEGKSVKVTGKLDASSANLLHVNTIEVFTA